MAKKKQPINKVKNENTFQHPEPVKVGASRKIAQPVIPTGDRRHIAAVREGAVSGEIFCRNAARRRDLGLPRLPTPEIDFVAELRS